VDLDPAKLLLAPGSVVLLLTQHRDESLVRGFVLGGQLDRVLRALARLFELAVQAKRVGEADVIEAHRARAELDGASRRANRFAILGFLAEEQGPDVPELVSIGLALERLVDGLDRLVIAPLRGEVEGEVAPNEAVGRHAPQSLAESFLRALWFFEAQHRADRQLTDWRVGPELFDRYGNVSGTFGLTSSRDGVAQHHVEEQLRTRRAEYRFLQPVCSFAPATWSARRAHVGIGEHRLEETLERRAWWSQLAIGRLGLFAAFAEDSRKGAHALDQGGAAQRIGHGVQLGVGRRAVDGAQQVQIEEPGFGVMWIELEDLLRDVATLFDFVGVEGDVSVLEQLLDAFLAFELSATGEGRRSLLHVETECARDE
jgi:hypothetical protein